MHLLVVCVVNSIKLFNTEVFPLNSSSAYKFELPYLSVKKVLVKLGHIEKFIQLQYLMK